MLGGENQYETFPAAITGIIDPLSTDPLAFEHSAGCDSSISLMYLHDL